MGAEKSKLAKATGYSGSKIQKLEARFEAICSTRRDKFDATTLHVKMRLDYEMSLLLCRFFDRECTNDVSFPDFVLGVHALGPGSIALKADYLFRACDIGRHGYLVPRNVRDVMEDSTKYVTLNDVISSFRQVNELLGGKDTDIALYSQQNIECEANLSASSPAVAAPSDVTATTAATAATAASSSSSSASAYSNRKVGSLGTNSNWSGSRKKYGRAASLAHEWLLKQPPLPAAVKQSTVHLATEGGFDGNTSGVHGSTASVNEHQELIVQFKIFGSFLAVALVLAKQLRRVPSVSDCMASICSALFAVATESSRLSNAETSNACVALLPTLISPASPSLPASSNRPAKMSETGGGIVSEYSIGEEKRFHGEGLVDSDVSRSWKRRVIQRKSFVAFCQENPCVLVSNLAVLRFLLEKVYAVRRCARIRPEYDPYSVSNNSFGQSLITIDLNNLKKTERDIKKKDQQREEDRLKAKQKEMAALDHLEKQEQKRIKKKLY